MMSNILLVMYIEDILELFPYPLNLFLRCEEYVQREHQPHVFINPRRREQRGEGREGEGGRGEIGEEVLVS